MRFSVAALDHAFPQPQSHQKIFFAQVGILIHPLFKHPSHISKRENDCSITTRNGQFFGMSLPSTMEIYTIILAIHCMESAFHTGTIYTDYQNAVRVANNPSLFHSMERKGNLPLFQYILIQLKRIADLIAKNRNPPSLMHIQT